MDEDYEEYDSEGEGKANWGGYGVGIAIGIALGLFVFGSPKYEGEKAEYWYNLYADYEYYFSQAKDCLSEIESIADFNSYGEDYEDMQDAFDEILNIAANCE